MKSWTGRESIASENHLSSSSSMADDFEQLFSSLGLTFFPCEMGILVLPFMAAVKIK